MSLVAGEPLKPAYKAKHFEFMYEPIYVAKKAPPDYRERFVGYGATRNTQVYEMLLQDYKFSVLSNVFLSHLGMSFSKDDYSESRVAQLEDNHVKYRQFFRDMKKQYGKDPFHKAD